MRERGRDRQKRCWWRKKTEHLLAVCILPDGPCRPRHIWALPHPPPPLNLPFTILFHLPWFPLDSGSHPESANLCQRPTISLLATSKISTNLIFMKILPDSRSLENKVLIRFWVSSGLQLSTYFDQIWYNSLLPRTSKFQRGTEEKKD